MPGGQRVRPWHRQLPRLHLDEDVTPTGAEEEENDDDDSIGGRAVKSVDRGGGSSTSGEDVDATSSLPLDDSPIAYANIYSTAEVLVKKASDLYSAEKFDEALLVFIEALGVISQHYGVKFNYGEKKKKKN